jgi:hypothetical protein
VGWTKFDVTTNCVSLILHVCWKWGEKERQERDDDHLACVYLDLVAHEKQPDLQ